MFIFKNIPDLRQYIAQQQQIGHSIALVPTMGALHDGHLSLVAQSIHDKHITICSIFVNPTQFNQQSDFDLYPRLPESDIEKLLHAGCHAVFMPSAAEMYPQGQQIEHYDFGAITNRLEGAHRPGHFDGVITIVKRLFDIVTPQVAYFGQKDFQQCLVVKALIEHFKLPVTLRIMNTIREADGLAMSSRNARLTAEERKQAVIIYETLSELTHQKGAVPLAQAKAQALAKLQTQFKTEYLDIAYADTFEPIEEWRADLPCVALVAAWCGNVRLIDNMLF